jgi:DNA excision repair protein ERCC-3
MTAGFNTFFYTLISADTPEMYYSNKRQQYLVEQGYTFKVVANLLETTGFASKLLPGKKEELDLLEAVLNADATGDLDKEMAQEDGRVKELNTDKLPARRSRGSTSALSGGSGLRYMEYSSGRAKKRPKKHGRLEKARKKFNSSIRRG